MVGDYIFHWPPHPGTSIAILGLIAALVSLKSPEKPWPRWVRPALTAFFFGLCLVEIYAVGNDRSEQDSQHLKDVGDLNRQFGETLGSIQRTFGMVETTESEVGQVQTKLHVLQIYISALQEGQKSESAAITELKENAAKPLSDLPIETLRKLAQDDSTRLRGVSYYPLIADDGPHYSSGYRDKWTADQIKADRQKYYDDKMGYYRNEVLAVLSEADTVRRLLLKRATNHLPEDDQQAESFQAALKGNISNLFAGSAADYLQRLSARLDSKISN